MPSFRYIVVNKENKQLAGIVDSPTIEMAQKELQELGFSIVSIEEQKKGEEEPGTVFEFKGVDASKKDIAGTIKSENRFQAFKRLISEYELDVKYVVQDDLSTKEKVKQKQEGVKELMKQLQETVKGKTDLLHKKKLAELDRDFDKKKALLMRQVDYIMGKINEALVLFDKEIKIEDKQKIKDLMNKSMRLKNSTNLDYLKKTVQDLLKLTQDPEIFNEKETNINEKLKLYAESEDMLNHIEKEKDFGLQDDFEDKLLLWQTENIKGKEKIPPEDKVKNGIFSLIIRIIHQPKEIRKIHKEIKLLSKESRQYYRVYLKTQDPAYRKEAASSLKKNKVIKIKLLAKLKKLKITEKKKRKNSNDLTLLESIMDSINGITGWLLFFYLILYFLSGIIISKELFFGFTEIPSLLFLFQSGLIKYVLPVIFLLHITASLKLNFFKKNFIADIVLLPGFAILSLIVIFNF